MRKRLERIGVGLAALLALASGCRTREAWSGPPGFARRIAVTHFHPDSASRSAEAKNLTDSLVARLAGVGGVQSLLIPDDQADQADFVVRGDVAVREGRLVVVARLRKPGTNVDLWSGTFWRGAGMQSDLVGELTAGLAEAVYSYLAREAVETRKDKN